MDVDLAVTYRKDCMCEVKSLCVISLKEDIGSIPEKKIFLG